MRGNAPVEKRVTLTLESGVLKGAMFLRQELASAEVADGSRVEVAANMGGGAVLVTYYPKKKDGEEATWTTYVIGAEELVRAVLKAEGKL